MALVKRDGLRRRRRHAAGAVVALAAATLAGQAHLARDAAAQPAPSASASTPRPPDLEPLALDVAVTEIDGQPVASDAWIAAEVAEAERLLAPHGVHLRLARQRRLPGPYAVLENTAARDTLAAHLTPGALAVFVVRTLRDSEDPKVERQGVRWRYLRDLRKDYVILSTAASLSTLAHELGHALGNGHSTVVNNVMSYERDDPAALAFDATQGLRLRAAAGRLLAAWRALTTPSAPAQP